MTNNDLSDLLKLLEGGVKCCSEDMNKNNKKIDLRNVFDGVQIKLGKYFPVECYLSEFINFVFENIDKIQLDGRLMHLIRYSFISLYGRKIIKNKRLSVVIGAILEKQNFVYKKDGSTMRQKFEQECTKFGISTSCNQDDIFLVEEKLYLVDKNVGINQFNSVRDFFEYVCSKVNTQEGKRYFDLLIRLIDNENNIFFVEEKLYLVDKNMGILLFDSLDNFVEYVYSNINTPEGKRYANSLLKLFDYDVSRYVNSRYYMCLKSKIKGDFCTLSNTSVGSISYYSFTLISKILESQNASEPLLNKLEKVRDGFDSFCFRVYVYVIFPMKRFFQGQPPHQPKIIKDNEITQPKEINDNEISVMPESEIETGKTGYNSNKFIK